ncbi:GNAT family N-acetyltransferase [Streptomyces nigra]
MTLPTPTLHTARLRLRPFTDADAAPLYALHSSSHVMRYWDSPPWTDRARAERFIAVCRTMAEEGTGARVAIDRASDGAFVGWCGLSGWNPDYRSASLGYVLGDAMWGHGYATEAAHALLRWAFETLDLNRVQAEADSRVWPVGLWLGGGCSLLRRPGDARGGLGCRGARCLGRVPIPAGLGCGAGGRGRG